MQDGKYVILCTDDDPDLLDILRTILEPNGYIMHEAGSAEDGLKEYKRVHPDLLIVDLMMEEVDAGVTLARELRLLDNKAPVFLLSSVGDQISQNIDFADLGLSGVFQKPIDSKMLLSVLKTKLPKA
jgi:two-component system response regulator VicR